MPGIAVWQLIVLVGGAAWCRSVLPKAAEHARVLRGPAEPAEKAAVAALWLLTLVVGTWALRAGLDVARGLLLLAG